MPPTPEQIEFGTTALLTALAARNLETGDHCPRVNRLAMQLGRALRLPPPDLYALKFGSLLHDVGKLQTPDAVLCKPGPLDQTDWQKMRLHPIDGGSILRALDFPEDISLIVEQHHERVDGQGYPFGLRKNEISFAARVFAVADAFDAITRNRCYRKGASVETALHEIDSSRDTQFDPVVVDALLQLYGPDNQQQAA